MDISEDNFDVDHFGDLPLSMQSPLYHAPALMTGTIGSRALSLPVGNTGAIPIVKTSPVVSAPVVSAPSGPLGYVQATAPVVIKKEVQPATTIYDTSGQPVATQPAQQQTVIAAQPIQNIPQQNSASQLQTIVDQFTAGFKGLFQPSSQSQAQQPVYVQGQIPYAQTGGDASLTGTATQIIGTNPALYGLVALAVIAVVMYFVFIKK